MLTDIDFEPALLAIDHLMNIYTT